jgi:SNF2 family DNA or RNA helicase
VIQADLIDGRIRLTGYSRRDRDAMRQVPGYSHKNGVTTCPVTWVALTILSAEFGDRIELSDSLREWAWNEWETRVGPASESNDWASDPYNDDEGNESLYPYQRTGVSFLLDAQNAGNFDSMGTGKTAQAIEFLEQLQAYPALIVVPKSAKSGWRREFARCAPEVDLCNVVGNITQRRKLLSEDHDVFLITWESHSRIKGYGQIRLTPNEKTTKELNRPWGAVIADEAHHALNPKAKMTRALWAIGDTAQHRIPLTGTPSANDTSDFWAILHFIDPDEWPSKVLFRERYCLSAWNAWGGLDITGLNPEHKDEFYSLVKPRFIRRPKDIVLPWLPPKTYETWDVEMTKDQAKIYRALEERTIAEVEGGFVKGFNPLIAATRLTQAACATLTMEGDKVRLSAPSSKVNALREVVEELGDKSLIVFAASRQLIELAATQMEKDKRTFSKIVGGQSEMVRYNEEQAFQDGTNQLILLTMSAGSEALTLTAADTMCFLQRSWSLKENLQAEDRFHRPGQTSDNVLIIDLVAPDTIEIGQWVAITEKNYMLEEIVQDHETMLRVMRGC